MGGVKKKYTVLKDCVINFGNGSTLECSVTNQENTFGYQWFETQELFDQQVELGLIREGLPEGVDIPE